jgi:hypothetical protein
MQTFQCRQGFYGHQAARMAAAAFACVALWWHSGDRTILCLAVFIAVCALLSFHSMMNNEPALSFDEDNVRINTPFGVNEYAWQDVTGIYMQKVGGSRILMMPIGGSMCICFKTSRMSLTFGCTWLPVSAVDLPPGGVSELLDTLIHTWEKATHTDRSGDGVPGQLQDEPA